MVRGSQPDFWKTFIRLFGPYFGVRFRLQIKAVVPLCIFLLVYQVIILRSTIQAPLELSLGLLACIAGLTLFLEGVQQAVMRLGEELGDRLPRKCGAFAIMGSIFTLGFLSTLAEPSIGALGSALPENADAALKSLLGERRGFLVASVGLGVGIASVLGVVRMMLELSGRFMVSVTVLPLMALSIWVALKPELAPVVALAFDCGAVTTGPVTVPIVLALGVGLGNALGRTGNPLSGFGIVTMASLIPVIAVLIYASNPFEASTQALEVSGSEGAGVFMSSLQESTRAVVPLLGFLFVLYRFGLGRRLPRDMWFFYGGLLCLAGMALFLFGLKTGLIPLGSQCGQLAAQAIANPETTHFEHPYVAKVLVVLFAFGLGFGATLAEPALATLGRTVEDLTSGSLMSKALIYTVACGVGLGLMLGVVAFLLGRGIFPVLAVLYGITLILTWLSPDWLNLVAWDAAGVTTGPVTVPLVLALGTGLASGLGRTDLFGLLALASICPIFATLVLGLIKARRGGEA